jgi:Cft2 family RNA processing exonuclease
LRVESRAASTPCAGLARGAPQHPTLHTPLLFTNLTRAAEIGANCYRLELAGKRVILDAGMHPRRDGAEGLPLLDLVSPDTADAIVLSHAHQDHLGALPVLMRQQPRAPVFMTEATRQLSDQMLHNSANVMQFKTEAGEMPRPHFTHREVDVCAKRWRTAPLHTRFDLTGERLRPDEDADVSLEFFDAGHILGSVGTLIRAEGRTVLYAGDVQFDDQTIMQAARLPEEPVDVLIMETTRGDRATPEGFTRAGEERRLAEAIQAAFDRGGAVLIPVFALGKTQELLAMLHEFHRRRWLPVCPIYIGGLGTKLTEIYDRLAHHTPRQRADLDLLHTVAPFTMAGKAADATPVKPRRIYALSSGMMTEKTLSNSYARHFLSDPQQTLLFVGYADPESPAGKLRATPPGEMVQLDPARPPQPLRCHTEVFNFSAHASRETIRAYVNKVRPKKVLLVHGDPAALEWFRATLAADLPGSEMVLPPPGQAVEL